MYVGAERVLHGDIPYKDFWIPYPPGSFWLLAAAFRLFGSSALVGRAVGVLLRSLLTAATYLVATKVMRPSKAFVVSCAVFVWMIRGTYHTYPVIPAICCIQIGLFFFDRYLKTNHPWSLFAVGLWAGGATLFRHDFGVAFFSILSLSVLLRDRPLLFKERLRTSLYLYGAFLLVLLLPIAYFLLTGVPLEEVARDLIVFPLHISPITTTQAVQKIAPGDRVPLCLTLLSLGWGIFFILQRRLRNQWGNQEHFATVLLFLGILFLIPAGIKTDFSHFFGSFSFSLLIAGYTFERWTETPKNAMSFLQKMFLPLTTALFLFFLCLRPTLDLFLMAHQRSYAHPLPRAKGFSYEPFDAVQISAIRYLQAHVPADRKIYVGLTQHRRIYVNDVLFYFLAERASATRYHQLHPGVVDRDDVQQEMVRDLEKDKTSYIVLWYLQDSPLRPLPQKEGSYRLDHFIRTHYQLAASFGPYYILKLKNE